MNSFDRELGKERFVGAAKVQHYPGVGEKAQTVSLSHAGSRAPFQVPGREMAKAICGGPSSCPPQGGACLRLRTEASPGLGMMGRRATQGHR